MYIKVIPSFLFTISIYRYIIIVEDISKHKYMTQLTQQQRDVIKESAKYSLKIAWEQTKQFKRENNERARRAVQAKKLVTLFNQ